MALAVWPSTLNYKLDSNSLKLDLKDSVARSEFDDGPMLARMRFTNPNYIYSGNLTLTNAEYGVFLGFYKNVLSQGTRWFTIPAWGGLDYTTVKARFSETPTISDAGWDQYSIGISLEVKSYPVLSDFATYLLSLYSEDFIINGLSDPLQKIVNIDYPKAMNAYI